MLILLWGPGSETQLARVRQELERQRAPVAFVDQRDIQATDIELDVDGAIRGCLAVRDRRIDLAEIGATYVRAYDSCQLPAIRRAGPGSSAWWHAAAVDAAFLIWLSITPSSVINRPAAAAPNNSKPYQ